MSSCIVASRSEILSLVDQRAADFRVFLESAARYERVGGWQPKASERAPPIPPALA